MADRAAVRIAGVAAPRLACALALVVAFASGGFAQTPDGHSEHHPGGAPGTPPQATPPAAAPPAPSMPGGMGGMMEHRPAKPFYPALMDLPALSPEERQAIEAKAHARISAGIDEIARAEEALRHAHAAKDTAAAAQAAQRLRDGLDQVSSGTAALRALAAGQPPRQIARDWFRQQMNLPMADAPSASTGPTWFHAVSMALLAAFSLAMAGAYVARLRRANALVEHLTRVPPAAPVATPPVAAAPNDRAAAASPRPADTPWKGRLRVAAIFQETPNVKTFRLRDPDNGPIPFAFQPGQFMTFSAEIGGKLVRRSYTIASSAAQTSYVEATVKREDAGVFSEHMHSAIAPGDLIDVIAPSGTFTFRGVEAESVVLIGGGVGITPLMAAIRYLCDTAWPGDIFLVYGARTTEDFIFREELESLQRRHANVRVVATMGRRTGTAWMGPEGPITKELLSRAVPDIAQRRIHLCGPPAMMETVRTILSELGVSDERIKTEAFGPALGAVPPPGRTVVMDLPPATQAPPSVGPATATIRFATSNKSAPLPPDRTVLEIAESIDVPIDYACRVGTCGICKTRLLEGGVTMEVDEALTPEDRSRNIILACQAKSIANLVVEA